MSRSHMRLQAALLYERLRTVLTSEPAVVCVNPYVLPERGLPGVGSPAEVTDEVSLATVPRRVFAQLLLRKEPHITFCAPVLPLHKVISLRMQRQRLSLVESLVACLALQHQRLRAVHIHHMLVPGAVDAELLAAIGALAGPPFVNVNDPLVVFLLDVAIENFRAVVTIERAPVVLVAVALEVLTVDEARVANAADVISIVRVHMLLQLLEFAEVVGAEDAA